MMRRPAAWARITATAAELMQPDHPTHRDNANPPAIPDHTLLRPIGRGAYGEVWLARNIMGALRAVKIIWRRQFEHERPFEREFDGIQRFEPVSRSSGGLVHVLHVGRNEAEGYFYYVMELADRLPASGSSGKNDDGEIETTETYSPRTLRSDLMRRGRLAPSECLRLAVEIVSGLAQLHRQGLVHRDVKPGNIIYVQGRAKLADIGLVSSGQEGRTFVGTEGYIPPEGPGSPAADLYALGVVLYESSTGNSPEKFPDVPAEWFSEQADGEALEFHEIILKACEAQRERRYATAESMQADLALLQSGQSIRRARALERRYAQLRWSGIVGTILLVCALVAALFASYRAKVAAEISANEAKLRQAAQASLARAESAEEESRQQLYAALLEQGRANVRSGELGQRVKALDAVQRASAISNSAALRGVALAAHALPDLRFARELPYGADYTIRQPDFAFERIAVCRRRGPVEIRSLGDQRLLATLPASTNLPAYVAEWSPDGRFLAVKRDHPPNGFRSDREIWSMQKAQRRLLLPDVPFDVCAFHPRLARLLVARKEGLVVLDLETGDEISRLPLNQEFRWLRFAPDGEKFAANYLRGQAWVISIYQGSTGELIASNTFDKYVSTFNWHPSGEWIAVADRGGNVHRMDARTGEIRTLGRHKAQAVRVDFSPAGDYLMSGGWERELICWDVRTLQRSFTAFLDGGYVGWFSRDGKTYALATKAGFQLRSFEAASGHREFAEDLGPLLRYAAFSADGRWLAAAGSERLGVWDLQSRGPGALVTNVWETRVAFAANGELFADHLGDANRWKISPGANPTGPPELRPLELALPERFASLSVISNGAVLTGGSGSGVVNSDDLPTGTHDGSPTVWGYNGVSGDGNWLAVCQLNTPQLHVYRLPGVEPVAILTNGSRIGAFQFSPAGEELAVSCRDGVEFWSTATWQRTRARGDFTSQRYSPDGRTMWLTQEIRTGGLYDAHTLELLLPLPIGTYPLAVSPDGRKLAVSVDLRRLQVWDLAEVRQQLAKLGLDWQD